jgi:hypothetical protein
MVAKVYRLWRRRGASDVPFVSRRQAAYFFWKGKHSPTWRKRAKEWAGKTNFDALPEQAKSEAIRRYRRKRRPRGNL